MAEDDLQQREKNYLDAVKLRSKVEAQYSNEFLMAKVQDVTDKTAEHMANTKLGEELATVRALEFIARKRLDNAD